MAEPEESIPSVLLPCNSCGRTFRPDALSKHAKYCEKSLIKKRKVFDSAKQRLQGTDLAEFLPVITQKKKVDKSPIRKTQSKWKEKHLEFVGAIRAAKGGPSSDSGAPAPPAKPVDHEKCLYCDRYFGPKAYDRHLEWCKEHSSRIRPKSPASIQAKERLEARTKYKAPLLNRTRRASISEKCSPKTCTRDPSPAADRLTRTRSSSLSSRTVTSMNRETMSNVSPKTNTANTVDSFKRNQPARNSRRSVSPMKKPTPDAAKNKAINNNVNQNNRTRGRQVTQQELKNEARRDTKTTPKSVKDDIFSASCNISPITPGQNQKQKPRTPSRNSMENYDPYKSAERQMKELLGLSDDDDALVHSLVPQPPSSSTAPVLNSFNSAFAKFAPSHNSNRSPDSDLDNDFERLEAESRVTPTLADRCDGIVDKNFNPMSLSTISLCSTISIESFDNSRNNLRKGISSSAKVPSCDRKAQLPLQRSVSVVETPRRGRDFLKSNLKMEHLLFGVTGSNHYNNNNFNDNCDVSDDSSSDNKTLRSSNDLLKNSNSSLADTSPAEQELLKSVSEFEKLFAMPSTLNPYSPLIPNSSLSNTLTPLDHIDKHRSQANKFITDSAYNSMNRKSPQQSSPVEMDTCWSGGSSECSSTRGGAVAAAVVGVGASQTANFCHECGSKFPVLAAKFCCNCGVRRLVI